jgi:PIN domain nuclease of toxin-antitoxin system
MYCFGGCLETRSFRLRRRRSSATSKRPSLVSAVSGHEIATKFRLGKLAVPARLAEDLDQVVAENGWQPLPLSIAHGQLAGRLPGTHKDPFDRMLAAQALIEDVQMVTDDPAMEGFRVKLVW